MPTYVEYIQTNYANMQIELTNWIYRTSDSFEVIYKMASNPGARTNWPTLCATDMNNQPGNLFIQWNLWSNRTVINVGHAGSWAGDGSFSYNSPYDYDNYYKIQMLGNTFKLDKSADGETYENIVSSTVGEYNDTDTQTVKFFRGSNPVDLKLYSIKVYRGGALVHDYAPISTGLYDKVEELEIAPTGSGWTPGPEIEPPTPPVGDLSITLEYSASETNKVDKDLTEIATYTGTLRHETSIIDPVFIIECDLTEVIGANYLTVPAFNRSYFIKNIRSIRNNLVEFTCHVDVLSSFKTELRTNNAIINRSERNWNLYINDGSLKTKQNPYITTQEFSGGFGSDYSFILVIAG